MPEKDYQIHTWLMERRYFSLIIVLAFVILSATTFHICYRYHTINTEQTLKDDKLTTNLLSLVLDEHLKKIVGVMESYSNRRLLLQAVRDKNVKNASAHLINLTKSNPDIDSVIITDRQGTLWAAYPYRPEVLGKNFAYRDWYKDVSKEWKANVSDVFLRIVAEKDLAVAICVPIFDETGEVIGILVNTQRTIVLSNLIKQVPFDLGAFITVTDRKGQIIYSTQYDVEKKIRPYPFHPSFKKAMAANIKTLAVDDQEFGGRKRYISYAQVVNIGWTVFVERDKRSILLSESAYFIQVTTIAFLLFTSFILFLVYSRKQLMAQHLREQLKAKKSIEESEYKFRAMFENMAAASCLDEVIYENGKAVDYRIIDINPAFEKIMGVIKKDTVGKRASTLYGGGEILFLDTYIKVAETGQSISFEAYFPPINKYIRITASSPGKGKFSTVFSDITDRKQKEELINRQSKLLAAINKVFLETLTANNEESVAQACLNVAQDLTGSKFGFIGEITPEGLYTTTALSDPGWEACRIPEKQAILLMKDMVIRGIWGQVILKEQSLIVNDPVFYPDRVGIPEGHPPLTSFLGVPLRDQGKVIGMIAMANRVSGYTTTHQQDMEALSVAFVEAIRRKQAEKKINQLNIELEQRVLDRTVQLEAANKELEAFSYSVSHDLRAPLRSIDGFSQILLEKYQDKPLDDKGKTYLDRVRKATQRMSLLIDDMLKLSKITKAEFKRRDIDLSVMIRAIAEEQQKNNHDRVVDVTVQDGVIIQGDPYLMQIAMENVMGNAWKFTGKEAHPKIEFGTTVRDGETACFIRDNGAGFDMAYASKLFGAFQRLHTTDEFPGTGIGLATVKRIIYRHEGRIWAEGEVGKGTTFYFTVPSSQTARASL